MKISIFAVLCVLPIGSAVCQDYSLWYDVNNACENRWCINKPNGCCVGDDVVADLADWLSGWVSLDNHTLRGWTTQSNIADVTSNSEDLVDLVITKDGDIGQISDPINLYPAWAKNCATGITGGSCYLEIGGYGSVEYKTTPYSGYKCEDGCGTSNPVFVELGDGPRSYNLVDVTSNLGSDGIVTDTLVDESSIGLNLNGGSLSQEDMNIIYSTGDTIDLTPVMSDAEFCAWCPTSETGAKGASGGTRSRGASSVPEGCSTSIDVSDLSGGTSYYAVYTPSDNNKYIINYVNDGVLEQYTTVCEEGETVYTPVYLLQSANHLFLGWNINNKRYTHYAEITCNMDTLGVAPGNTVIVRAEWSPYLDYVARWINFVASCKDTDVPCFSAKPPYIYCQLNPNLSPYGCFYNYGTPQENYRLTKLNRLPQAEGKLFDGYYYNDEMIIDAEGNLIYDWQNFPSGTATTVELTPHWHDNPEGSLYTVTYDCGEAELREGKVLSTDTVVSYGQSFRPVSAQEYCYKKGYVEAGWSVSGLDYERIWSSSVSYNWRYLEDKIFTATWKPEYFYITYDCGKGVDVDGKIEQFNEVHSNNHVDLEDTAHYGVSFKPLDGDSCQLDGFEFDKWEVWDGYAKKYGKKFEGGVYQIWDYERDMPYGGWYGTIKLVATYKKSGEAENWVHYTVDDNGATIPNQVVVPSNYGAHEQLTEFWCQTNNNLSGYCAGCYLDEHCNSDEISELSRKPSKGNYNYFAGYYYGDTQVINQNGYITNPFTSGGPYEIVARWLQDFTVSYDCGDNNIVYSDTAHWGKTYSFNTNVCQAPSEYYTLAGWGGAGLTVHGNSITWNHPNDITMHPNWFDNRDWREAIKLVDEGSTFGGLESITWSLPDTIYCPRNQTDYPECVGCFTDMVCDEEHRFTGLTRIPTQLSGTYNGHVYYKHSDEDYSDIEYIQILDAQGNLISPATWVSEVGYMSYIPADWICADGYERVQKSDYIKCEPTSAITSEDKIQILYKMKTAYTDNLGRIRYRNMGYTGDIIFMICNVGSKLNLPGASDVAIDGYTFDHWEKNSFQYEPGQQLDCNRETLGGAIGESVIFTGYYNEL